MYNFPLSFTSYSAGARGRGRGSEGYQEGFVRLGPSFLPSRQLFDRLQLEGKNVQFLFRLEDVTYPILSIEIEDHWKVFEKLILG